jgi:hypothetical protein
MYNNKTINHHHYLPDNKHRVFPPVRTTYAVDVHKDAYTL